MIVLEARDRVGGRVLNARSRAAQGLRARRDVRGPHPGPHPRARQGEGVDTFPTYDTGDNVTSSRAALDLQRHRATGTAPPDPQILPDLATVVPRLDQMSTSVAGRRAVGGGEGRRVGRPDARELDQREHRRAALPRAGPSRHAPDLRRRPARALAALRPVLHRGVRQRAKPRHVRAQLQHPQRRAGVALHRRVAGHPAEDGRRAGQAGAAPQSPVRRIVQEGKGVRVESDRAIVRAKRVIVALPPALAGASTTSRSCRPRATSSCSACRRARCQGRGRVRAAVLARQGAHRHAVSTPAGSWHATFDDSPRGRVAGDRLRLRRAATRRAAYRACRCADGASACCGEFAEALGPEAAQRERLLRDRLARRALEPRRPGRRLRARRADRLRPAIREPRAGSTGRAPRRRRTGTATWTARCARASARRPRVLAELEPPPPARRPRGRSARGRASSSRSRARRCGRTRSSRGRRRARRRCRA